MTEFDKEVRSPTPTAAPDLSKRKALALPSLNAHLVFWPLMALGFTLDLWTKRAVFAYLRTTPSAELSIIDGFLKLVMAENPGAAFGIATGQRYLLVAVSVIALAVIVVVFLFSGAKERLVHIALGLFAAGVFGNLYDRIFNNGLVRDFIDVKYWPGRSWPAFNVADSMLCIGVGLLIISSLYVPKQPKSSAESRFTEQSGQKRALQRK